MASGVSAVLVDIFYLLISVENKTLFEMNSVGCAQRTTRVKFDVKSVSL
jgi:hypothetical protein